MRFVLLAAATLVGCGRSPAVRIVKLRIVDRTASSDKTLRPTAQEVEEMVHKALRDRSLAWDEDGVGYRLRVEYALDRAEVADQGVMRAAVLLRLEPGEGMEATALESTGVIEHAYASGQRPDRAGVNRHLERAVREVGKGLLVQSRLLVGNAGDLVRALSDADPQVREVAIRLAGVRREQRAVEKLIELLQSPDERVGDAAIGALVAIGDRRAVRPLCERSRLGDVRGMAKVLDAIAALGGDEARAYLELVGSGHDDPGMRAMAKAALERMGRHKDR